MGCSARLVSGVLLVGGVLVGGVLVAAPAGAAPAGGPAFGTAPVSVAAGGAQATVTAVDAGRHAGFDRVVFRASGPSLGYTVRYEPRLVEDPTGRVLPLAGSAVLVVTLQATTWIEQPSPRVDRTYRFPALRQLRSAGEFEAVVSYGLGQSGRDGFRAFRLTGPDRIVVDLRHPTGTASAAPSPPASATSATSATSPAAAPPAAPSIGPAAATGSPSPVATAPAGDDTAPLPAFVIGLVVVGLLAAGGIALRAR
jgi:hypothetical protein